MTHLRNSFLAKALNPEEKVDWKTRRKLVLCNEESNGSYETLVQPCFRVYFLGANIPSRSSAYTKLF